MTQCKASEEILGQLLDLLQQLNQEEYALPLPILSGSSVGKHIRHIIEFYQCLLSGKEAGVVDYDHRMRNSNLEQNKQYAEGILGRLLNQLSFSAQDRSLQLAVRYDDHLPVDYVDTSFSRELVYNVEHTIHHMALIRIGVTAYFPYVNVDEHFGVAYSTIKYQKSQCAQ